MILVVPEGLAHGPDGITLSDHYEAVLAEVLRRAAPGEEVWLAPGNYFDGSKEREDVIAARFLAERRPDLRVGSTTPDVDHYVDTLDNAVYLRAHLERLGRWPLEAAALYCHAPHRRRSVWAFARVGFRIGETVFSRPTRTSRRMPRRLWYYDLAPAHAAYEALALFYNAARAIIRRW